MSNIYLKVTIEKGRRTQSLDFKNLKCMSNLKSSSDADIIEFSCC